MEPVIYKTQAEFHKWLHKNHAKEKEIYLLLYKAKSNKKGISYSEALDVALCYGWIDAVRKGIDDKSWMIRFTPRKPGSIWSNINVKHIERLIKEKRMKPAGMEAYNKRRADRTGIYSFEQDKHELSPAFEKQFKANKKAWANFQAMAPWYKRTAIHIVMRGKKEETRLRRLDELIKNSEGGNTIAELRWNKKK